MELSSVIFVAKQGVRQGGVLSLFVRHIHWRFDFGVRIYRCWLLCCYELYWCDNVLRWLWYTV